MTRSEVIPVKDANLGLMRRGFLLLGLMALLTGVVLYIALRRPRQELPVDQLRPEWLAPLAVTPQAGFPAALAWASFPQLGTALPSARGWEIRYNAVVALARRGSPALPLSLMREMLDEDQQMRNFRATLADGRDVADETAARRTVLSALKALAQWHTHAAAVQSVGSDNPALVQVYQAVDRLTHSPNLVVRTEAGKTRQAFKRT